MFLITFSICLLFANIVFYVKKKYIYLFIPCMLFLPEYYGMDFGNTLPLLSVTRIMFLVFYVYAFLNRKRNLSSIKFIPPSRMYFFLIGYFIFRIIPNLYYLFRYSDAIKTIIQICSEELLLLIAFYLLALSKAEIIKLLNVIAWSAFSLFIIGIFESFTGITLFDQLYTANRYLLNEHYTRLGLLRATTTMGLPGLYSNMCLMIIPLLLYLYSVSAQKQYLVLLFTDIFAGLHSGTRSFFFSLIIIMIIYLFYVLRSGDARKRGIKNLIVFLIALLLLTGVLSFNDNYRYFYTGTAKSLLNEIGFNYDLDYGAPNGTDGYGMNSGKSNDYSGGIASRKFQLSGIQNTMSRNPLFGLGNGALFRNEVYYKHNNIWYSFSTIDLGIIEIVTNEGLIGLIGFICLFIFLFISTNNRFSHLEIITFLLTTLSTTNLMHFLMLILAINCSTLLNIPSFYNRTLND